MKLPRIISLSKEESEKIFKFLQDHPSNLLEIANVQAFISKSRIDRIEDSDIEILENCKDVQPHVLWHNLKMLRGTEASGRPRILINPLMTISRVSRNYKDYKVLSIGPRSEEEIFCLMACGFKPDNITGVDLLSYSDFIELGDMHELPYEDNAFDIVIAGWVLAYSSDNQKAADEILRVVKPGGYVAVGCRTETFEPVWEEAIKRAVNCIGGVPCKSIEEGKEKIVSRYWFISQLAQLFIKGMAKLYFEHQPHPEDRNKRDDVILIFEVK